MSSNLKVLRGSIIKLFLDTVPSTWHASVHLPLRAPSGEAHFYLHLFVEMETKVGKIPDGDCQSRDLAQTA